jgi:hypothetical protein
LNQAQTRHSLRLMRTSRALPTPADDRPSPGHCENCITSRHGSYCYECGQRLVTPTSACVHSRTGILEAYWLIYDRILLTLRDLCNPGLIAANYVAGHRVRYVPPVRLFGLLSVFAFLIAQGAASIREDSAQLKVGVIQLGIHKSEGGGPTHLVGSAHPANTATAKALGSHASPAHPLASRPLPAERPHSLRQWIRDQGRKVDEKLDRVGDDPGRALIAVIQKAPSAILLMIPIFALILKITYVRSEWRYLEHLAVVTYSHAYLCMTLAAMFLASRVANALPQFESISALVSVLLCLWMPLYLLLSQKRVYGGNWPSTLARYLIAGFAYCGMAIITACTFAVINLLWP